MGAVALLGGLHFQELIPRRLHFQELIPRREARAVKCLSSGDSGGVSSAAGPAAVGRTKRVGRMQGGSHQEHGQPRGWWLCGTVKVLL